MKVSELIEQLQDMDPDTNIAMAIDEEGNGYYEEVEVAITNELVVLWPCGRQTELEEIEGYVDDEEDE